MTEDEFYDVYKPQKNHLNDNASFDGCMYEAYGEEVKYVFELAGRENRVWTIIEGDDDGKLYYEAGFHYVNRLGFLVTEKEWETGDELIEVE